MNNYIKEILELKELELKSISTEGNIKYYHLECKITAQKCPYCGAMATKSKGYGRERNIKDTMIKEYQTILVYKPKRLRCECGKTFTVKCEDIPGKNRMTVTVREKIVDDLRYDKSLKEIAKENNVSISTVIRVLDKISYVEDEIGEVVCIDDFKGNLNGEKFQTQMTNPITKRITNIYPSRKKDDLIREIIKIPREKRDKVKFYICDMNETYIYIGKELFRNAKIVIDRFHYTKLLTEAINKVRIRVQEKLSDKERKYFKHNKWLVIKRKENLKVSEKKNEKNLLDRMLNVSEELTKAYGLLQEFYTFNTTKNKEELTNKFKKFRDECEESEIEEFQKAIKTIIKYYEYIRNSFDTPYTNGYAEGNNNKIKNSKRTGYGYKNLERFKKRMMHLD